MSPQLADTTWTNLPQHPVLLVPLGSTEQHGPHLPFTVDVDIATAVTRRAGDFLGAVVAPALAYGSSGEHAGFPGTLSIGTTALATILVELVRSARWASRIAFINGHGGNVDALVSAVRQVRYEKHDVGWAPCAVDGMDLHAGRAETSLMLELRPETVGPERPVGVTEPVESLLSRLRAQGVGSVSANGVLGDARDASTDEGENLLAAMTTAMMRRLRRWAPDANGLLLDQQ
ncbi:mycofactocin biosynthesis peptidyl-dipeptidase MftE [Microbacterium sp. X-17]|uniref:mycofactocin biosynthesis peptidyl-dipeptidase MftE n=1 Tax=Microbacterium sp. X-17 TaxID=3144404 RepID=UPI0031F4BB4F